MGILALLLAVTVPAFRGINQGGSRRAAVSNLMGVLDRARMMAVSDGLSTYVAFACKPPGGNGPYVNPNLYGRAYAIFQDQDNVNFGIVQRTPWLYLPDGVAFKVDQGIPSITGRALGDTDPAFPATGAAATVGAGTVKLPYWKFDSTGALDQQTTSNNLRMFLFSGHVDSNGNEISTQNTGGTASTTASLLDEIDVNQVTGRAKYIVDQANNLATPGT